MTQKSFTYLIILLFAAILTQAQVPEGYYTSAEGLTGEQLKIALHEIIKGHTMFPYTSSNTDTWDILKESDKDTSNSENVLLVYSGWSVNAAQEYNNGDGWTREHTWAKSHGGFDTDMGVGTDLHNLKPCDNTVNSARSNLDFDNGGTIYVDGDGETECRKDADSWEPRDKVKGDVARILFYMATRYEGDNGEIDLELVDAVNTANIYGLNMGYHGKLSTLLEWHVSDPVDSFEINRNNVIYSYQNNRNPFIDHPEYVKKIWGNDCIAPELLDDSASTVINQSIEISVLSNDYDSNSSIDTSTLEILTNPNYGLVTVDNESGIVTYTPDNNYVGQDIFRYSVCDDGSPCDVPICGEAIVFITIENVTSANDIENSDSELKIYPNPAKDYITIETSEPAQGTIFSLQGEILKQFEVKRKLSVQNLNPGIYFILIATEKEIYNSKLIIR